MPNDISKHPIHLGLGARAYSEPPFTGMSWYMEYGKRHEKDGKEGRLVSFHTFQESWDSWEMHPHGEEVVLCVEGAITLIQEVDGESTSVTLHKNEYAINPAGVWHTADVSGGASCLFITAGLGTENRPR